MDVADSAVVFSWSSVSVLISALPMSSSSSWVAKPVQGVLTGVLTLASKDGSICAAGLALCIACSLKECRTLRWKTRMAYR